MAGRLRSSTNVSIHRAVPVILCAEHFSYKFFELSQSSPETLIKAPCRQHSLPPLFLSLLFTLLLLALGSLIFCFKLRARSLLNLLHAAPKAKPNPLLSFLFSPFFVAVIFLAVKWPGLSP